MTFPCERALRPPSLFDATEPLVAASLTGERLNARSALGHSLSVLTLLSSACFAAPPARAAGAKPQKLEEITVTAQKTRANLQKVPASVTSISAKTLDKTNVTTVLDLDGHLPGTSVNVNGANPLDITIRGVGFQGLQNGSAQPSVSYNENGVYIANPYALNADFLDIENVELLRGPQGTVLGQNSDGGAFNVTTVQPVLGVYDGTGDVSYGSYDLVRSRLAANLPTSPTTAVRVAIEQERHDGWSTATDVPGTPNYPLSNEDSITARIEGLWTPTEKLTFHAWGEFYQDWANGAALKNIFDPNPNPRELTQDYPSKIDVNSDVFAADAAYDFGFATLKGTMSYQIINTSTPEDVDRLNYQTAIQLYGEHDIASNYLAVGHAYTEEINLSSKPGGRLDWIVGAFFLRQSTNGTFVEYQQSKPGLPTPGDALSFTGSQTGQFFADQGSFLSRFTDVRNSGSGYSQATYHVTNRLRFTGGLRVTDETETGHVANYYAAPVKLPERFTAVTGKADVEYDLAPTKMIYAMFSSGVKSGGTNLNPEATVVPTAFLPEYVKAFEFGSKNQFNNKRIRLNIAAYYNIIDNYQTEGEDPIPFQGGQTNVGRVDVWGIETEGTALLPYDLRLDGNFSLSDGRVMSHTTLLDPVTAQADNARYGIFTPADVAARAASSRDVYGKTPSLLPPFSTWISLTHTFIMERIGTLESTIQFNYRMGYFARVYDNPLTDRVPDSRQLNLNFDFHPRRGPWHVQFQVINVANSNSVNSRYADAFGSGEVMNYYIPPRQFIGRLGVSF